MIYEEAPRSQSATNLATQVTPPLVAQQSGSQSAVTSPLLPLRSITPAVAALPSALAHLAQFRRLSSKNVTQPDANQSANQAATSTSRSASPRRSVRVANRKSPTIPNVSATDPINPEMCLSSMSISKTPPLPSVERMLSTVSGSVVQIPFLDYPTRMQSTSNIQQAGPTTVLPPITSIFMHDVNPFNPILPGLNIGPIRSSTNPIVVFKPTILTTAVSSMSLTPTTIIPSTLAPVSPVSTIPAVRTPATIVQPTVAVTQVTASSA